MCSLYQIGEVVNLKFAAYESETQIEFIVATGANVFSQTIL
jgi:hypothetical protein